MMVLEAVFKATKRAGMPGVGTLFRPLTLLLRYVAAAKKNPDPVPSAPPRKHEDHFG
jgi:hypothetical protein